MQNEIFHKIVWPTFLKALETFAVYKLVAFKSNIMKPWKETKKHIGKEILLGSKSLLETFVKTVEGCSNIEGFFSIYFVLF